MRTMLPHLTPAMRLRRRVDTWTVRLRVSPRVVRIQTMTRKWGSFSSAGTITLARDLDDQPPGFQDFVIAHELLHLRVPNHSRLFKSLMTVHVPNWRVYDVARRQALDLSSPLRIRDFVIQAARRTLW
jgi:predicted metal-dependent hydrolase